jgi:hypothetical protein
MCTLSGFGKINYDQMRRAPRLARFETAFQAAEAYGIPVMLDAHDMAQMAHPDKYSVTLYLSEIYKAFK